MKKTLTALSCMGLLSLGLASGVSAGFLDDLKKGADQIMTNSGSDSGAASTGSLGVTEVTEGLKEALRVGTERVVAQIGAAGGYENDSAIHIPLPEKLQQAQSWLRKLGLSDLADDVESRMNKGAEAAAPKAKELIWKAIEGMTLEDAQKIYDGPDDAATQYFRKVSSADLADAVRPVMDEALSDAGAIAAYDQLVGEFSKYPLVPNVKSDLTEHATDLALEGVFHYLAQEEAAIRNDPIARTTDILKSVFGI